MICTKYPGLFPILLQARIHSQSPRLQSQDLRFETLNFACEHETSSYASTIKYYSKYCTRQRVLHPSRNKYTHYTSSLIINICVFIPKIAVTFNVS